MHYTYLETYGFIYGVDEQFVHFSTPEQPIFELIDPYRYRQVYFKVTSENDPDTFLYIPSQQVISIPGAINSTVGSLFNQDIPEDLFEPLLSIPTEEIRYLSYQNARSLNLQIGLDSAESFQPSNPFKPIEDHPDPLIPLKDLPDLVLALPRYATDLTRLHSHAIVTVNGFAHQTVLSDETENVVYIKDAGKTSTISNKSSVGIIHFENVGQINQYPLSELHLVPDEDDGFNGIIEIDEVPEDLTDKSIILSIGGYLIFPQPGVSFIYDTHTVKLDVSKIDLRTKIVEASKYLNLSSLSLGNLFANPIEDTSIDILDYDETIKAFLELSQSFLIVVPKNNIIVYENFVRRYNNDRNFITDYEPTQIFRTQTGRVVEYWAEMLNDYYQVNLLTFINHINISTSHLYDQLVQAFGNEINLQQQTRYANGTLSIGFYNT